jgi:chloride channel protein, CIC family
VVAVGASVAYLAVRSVGPGPTPYIETLPLPGAWTVPLALVIGLLGGAISAALVRLLFTLEHAVVRWDGVPRWLKPTMGGAVLGLAGLAAPQLLGIGYATLEAVAAGELPGWELLLLFTVGKLLLMVVSFGSGFRGGFFAPSLFIGAMLGALCGIGAAALLPGAGLEPAALATLGMAAVLAGAVRAPFTVTLLIPALSGDYAQAPALLVAALAGTGASRLLEQDSVYTYAIAHPAKEAAYEHPPRPQRDVSQQCRALTIGQRRAPSAVADDSTPSP